MLDMSAVADASVDAIYSAQTAVLQTARIAYSKALQEHLSGFGGDAIKLPN